MGSSSPVAPGRDGRQGGPGGGARLGPRMGRRATPGTRPTPRILAGALPMPTPDQLYDQAVDLRDGGDKPAAIAKLEEAVAIDPNFAIGHGMLAKLYTDIAEAEKAIAHAKKVVELEPDDTFS